jgi:hypothetical protein
MAMEMFFMGGPVVIILMGLAGGNATHDLVSLIEAPDYFKAREIEVKPETLLRLAGKTPTDAASSIHQLLAIRWLGEHAGDLRQLKSGRETLQAIADGTQGKDPLGFARFYARQALARLDGKELPFHRLPGGSLRGEALAWFPKASSIFGGLDLRSSQALKTDASESMRTLFNAMLRPRDSKLFYDFVDKMGNIRIDRISFAVIPGANQDNDTRIYARVTGLADRKRLLAYIKKTENPRIEFEERKGRDEEPITVLNSKGDAPSMAVIGNTEFMVAGYAHGPRRNDHIGLIDEMLKIRAGKEAGLVKGPYAGTLRNSPAQAVGLLIGELPDRWRGELTGRGSPLPALPKDFNLSCTRTGRGLELRFTGNGANARDAKAFVESLERWRQEGIKGLKQLPNFIKVKPKQVDTLVATLKGIKVEAQDALLSGRATISNEAFEALRALLQAYVASEMRPLQPKGQAKG